MATLLMLMYKARGVVKEASVANVFTFGAPSVFLEPGICGCATSASEASASESTSAGAQLGGASGADIGPQPPVIATEQKRVQEVCAGQK